MVTHVHRLSIAARLLTGCAILLGAAAVFHFLAAPHLSPVLQKVVDPKAYAFLEPIVSFTFLLNGVLLLPLSFSTFYSAAGVRRGERWAWWIAMVNALTVLALLCTLVATMGLRYFADAPLFVAGAVSVSAAGMLMILSLSWARHAIVRPNEDNETVGMQM